MSQSVFFNVPQKKGSHASLKWHAGEEKKKSTSKQQYKQIRCKNTINVYIVS